MGSSQIREFANRFPNFAFEVLPKVSPQIASTNLSENLTEILLGLLENFEAKIVQDFCRKHKMILPAVTLRRVPPYIPQDFHKQLKRIQLGNCL